jgi:hypothetical protein
MLFQAHLQKRKTVTCITHAFVIAEQLKAWMLILSFLVLLQDADVKSRIAEDRFR